MPADNVMLNIWPAKVKKTVFKPRSREIGVDFWDTTNYTEALADMIVADIGWSHPAWDNWKNQRKAAVDRRKARSKQERRDILHT